MELGIVYKWETKILGKYKQTLLEKIECRDIMHT